MAKAFVSYSSKDMQMVMRLTNDLVVSSPLSIFFAPWDIAAGEKLITKIQNALMESDYFVPLLSPNFLASDWATEELEEAMTLAVQKKITVLPVLIEKCDLPPFIKARKYIDFVEKDYDIALNELVDSLRSANDPLRNLDSLKKFLASGDHTPQSLVALAKQVLNTQWTPEDDKGRGAQLIAKKLENEKYFQEALQVYDLTVNKFPKVLPLLILRSAIHRRLENFPKADQDCAKILRLDPGNVRALLTRFWINHDWIAREITPEEEKQRRYQAQTCLTKLQTIPAAKTTYLHGYLHALSQGAVLFQESSFAEEARQLLENQEEELLKRRGRDRDAVLKTFKILEGFYHECGKPDIAEALAKQREKFEDKWGRIV